MIKKILLKLLWKLSDDALFCQTPLAGIYVDQDIPEEIAEEDIEEYTFYFAKKNDKKKKIKRWLYGN